MSLTDEMATRLGLLWIPDIYRKNIRTQRTRAFDLSVPSRENKVEIVHTLLGIQLKTPGKLIACPDLSTARYLRVFVRIGCDDVAVPYDITKISSVADELESAWQQTLLYLEDMTSGLGIRSKSGHRGIMIKTMRTEIARAGAGGLMPDFDTETKQRKT